VVEILPEKDNALIKAVLPRKNSFSRRMAGGRKKIGGGEAVAQIIAANIDLAFIVVGLDRDYNPRRIERYMALVQSSGAEAVILLNKADLCEAKQLRKKEIRKLFPDTTVRMIVALDKKDVSSLRTYIKPGMTTAVLGSSGVGKSTIINNLLGYDKQSVKNISDKGGKGQHTTSRRELIILPRGGIIMDNPGMREIQLWGNEDDLFETFTDIEQHAKKCKFRNCRHKSEPGCAVRVAVDDGSVDEKRFLNYLKLKSELVQLGQKQKKG
jgi:ribosome biogenesis GTPase